MFLGDNRKISCLHDIKMTRGTCCSLATRMFSHPGRHVEYRNTCDKSPSLAIAFQLTFLSKQWSWLALDYCSECIIWVFMSFYADELKIVSRRLLTKRLTIFLCLITILSLFFHFSDDDLKPYPMDEEDDDVVNGVRPPVYLRDCISGESPSINVWILLSLWLYSVSPCISCCFVSFRIILESLILHRDFFSSLNAISFTGLLSKDDPSRLEACLLVAEKLIRREQAALPEVIYTWILLHFINIGNPYIRSPHNRPFIK